MIRRFHDNASITESAVCCCGVALCVRILDGHEAGSEGEVSLSRSMGFWWASLNTHGLFCEHLILSDKHLLSSA